MIPVSRRLLLISSSTVAGTGYLDHAEAEIRDHLGAIESVLFVPYALGDHSAYSAKVRERFARMDYKVDSIHDSADPVGAVERAEAVFIGGGNTFRLLKGLYDRHLIDPIRARVEAG